MLRYVLSLSLLASCGCVGTKQDLSLTHRIDVPKEYRWGNFSEHPGFSEGNSTIERYINAYERGWLIAVEEYAKDIDFDDPSPLVMSGWPEEAQGGGVGYSDARDRIEKLIRVYGKKQVADYLLQFRTLQE